MALGKVIQRIEIEMSGGTKQYMVSAKKEIGQQDMSKPYY